MIIHALGTILGIDKTTSQGMVEKGWFFLPGLGNGK